MSLVVFRSRAAAEIIMIAEDATRLLDCIGKPPAPRGVITCAQIDEALSRLEAAVQGERARGGDADVPDEPLSRQAISLRQRAFPLMEMLRAARRLGVDVTWGI